MEGWVTRPHGAGVGLPQMLRDLGAWDGIWYRSIAVHGYDPTIGHGDNAAFLPLYPMLLRGLRTLAPFVDLVWLGAAALDRSSWRSGCACSTSSPTSASGARSRGARCSSSRSRRSPSCSRPSTRRASSSCSSTGAFLLAERRPLPRRVGPRRARRAHAPGRPRARAGAHLDGLGRARGPLEARRCRSRCCPRPQAALHGLPVVGDGRSARADARAGARLGAQPRPAAARDLERLHRPRARPPRAALPRPHRLRARLDGRCSSSSGSAATRCRSRTSSSPPAAC